MTVGVTNVAPTFSSGGTASVAENATTAYTAAASDTAGGTVTYSLGGTDAGKFTINATTGVVSFVSGPSFEAPSDSGGNNVYDITVTASDGSATTTQAVAITVTNVAPTISSGSTGSVTEGATAGTTVYTAAATDPAGGTVTYSLTGTDASAFTINSSTGAVTINATPNFETKSSYSFNVVASDGSLTSTKAVTVGVTKVVEASPASTTTPTPDPVQVLPTPVPAPSPGGTAPVSNATGGGGASDSTSLSATGGSPMVPAGIVDPLLQSQPVNIAGDLASPQSSASNPSTADILNALPASAAGNAGDAGNGTSQAGTGADLASSDRGFPVVRVVLDAVPGAALDSTNTNADHRLFVLEGVKEARGETEFQISKETFGHTDPQAIVKLEARLISGEPLPSWVSFDPVSGTFRGTPPAGVASDVELLVVARDANSREASVVFRLELGVPGADASAGGASTAGAALQTSAASPSAGSAGADGSASQSGIFGETLKEVQGQSVGGLGATLEANASKDLGFPVARVSLSDVALVAGAESGEQAGGQRLFVFQGIIDAKAESEFQIRSDAFGHTDPSAIVRLEARTASGGPLPPWLQFDALTGTFRGMPPDGRAVTLELVVVARDDEGREATIFFNLELGAKPEADPAKVVETEEGPSAARIGAEEEAEEKDAEEIAAAEQEGVPVEVAKEKAKAAKTGAAPFSEQVRAAKGASDPLLAKILGSKETKQGGRPTSL